MKVSVPKLPSKRIPSLWTHNNRVKDANSPNRTTITLNVPEHSFQRRSNPSNIFVRTLTSYEVPQSTTSNMSVLGATTRKMQKLYEQGYYAAIETEWKKFTNAGWLPDGVMFGVIMKVYAKMGQIDKIKSMWRRMRFDGITPGWHHYLAKIQCLCEIRNMEAAEQTLTEMTIDGLPPDAEIYTTLIKGYANADPMSPRPQEIYSKMVQENIVTPATCTAMMLLYGRHGMQQADIFYQQLRGEKRIIPDDPSIYNALIVVCGATGNQDSIEMYLKEMEQAGVKKNHWTYRSLMKAYASSPTSYSKFLEVFEEYRAFGAQPEDYSHYVSRIAAMGEFQDLKKALETFQKDGIPYTVDMFNHIFDTLKKNEKWDTVEQVLDLMKQYRVPRNVRTYNIIMSGYGWCGKIPQMIQTFEQMRLEFQPDSYTLCTLMERCYHHHQYSQAVTFYYFARARMIYVPRQTIAHVVVSAVLSSQWSDVHKIMEEHNFSRLIYGPMVNALDHFGPEWNMKLLTTVQLSLPCAKWLLVYYARKQRINEALDVIEHVLSNHASFMPGSKRDTWSFFFEEMQRLQQAMLSANHPDIPYIRDAIRDFTLIVIPPPPPPPQPTYPTAVQQWEHSLGLQAQEPQGEALLEYEGQANIPLEYEGQANIPLEPEDEEEYEEEE